MTTDQTTCIRRCLSGASKARPEGAEETLVADRRLRFVELPQSYPLSWLRAGTLYAQIMTVPDAFIALPEFFRNSALNLTWSGSVPVWLTSLFRASLRAVCFNLRFVRDPRPSRLGDCVGGKHR